jgi:hypothetical protein
MRPILALILSLILTVPAFALSGATADGEDRFPYVVEIKFEQRLVCSGTVLFPRIVVTAAHCLQHKARWPGGLVYIDEYAQAAELTVAVTRGDKIETYDVAEVTISPAWRSEVSASNTVAGSNRNQRFAHDIALVVTKEPIAVGLPPSLIKLAAGDGLAPEDISCASKSAPAQGGTQAGDAALRDMLEKRLGHHAVLVAFGAESCTPRFCGEAGVRRYQNITLKESAECFVNRGSRSSQPTPSGDTAVSPSLAVWCMESNVLPGDSGGALLVEGPRGELYYLGVISAQQGRSLALASNVTKKRSVATALYPSLDFILEEARKLGYAR